MLVVRELATLEVLPTFLPFDVTFFPLMVVLILHVKLTVVRWQD